MAAASACAAADAGPNFTAYVSYGQPRLLLDRLVRADARARRVERLLHAARERRADAHRRAETLNLVPRSANPHADFGRHRPPPARPSPRPGACCRPCVSDDRAAGPTSAAPPRCVVERLAALPSSKSIASCSRLQDQRRLCAHVHLVIVVERVRLDRRERRGAAARIVQGRVDVIEASRPPLGKR